MRATRISDLLGVDITETMAELLQKHRLRWLGHVARMDNQRLPKQLLFGELKKRRPQHGVKRRWRDLMLADITTIGIEDWYTTAQDRHECRAYCQLHATDEGNATEDRICIANTSQPAGTFPCCCGRTFRRKGDLTRHSQFCDGTNGSRSQRSPPSASYECACGRSFRRKGDLTRHTRFCTIDS